MSNAKILLVEDDNIIAMDLKNRLETMGYTVLDTAASGEEAIEKADVTHPDLILMDITLKGPMDGVEAAERIRECLLAAVTQELPHATAVLIESWQERADGLLEIDATILVDRESQKQIVIGRSGQLLKRVGAEARRGLEEFLGRRVHLRTWVKVRRDWRDDRRTLRELGLQGPR